MLVAIAFGIGRLAGVSPVEPLRIDALAAGAGILAALPMLALLHWCLRTTWAPMRGLVALVEERLGPYLAGATAGGIVLLSALAGIGEELLFRGAIQQGLSGSLPGWLALTVASALFGVGHWLSATYAALAAGIGAYLGLVFLLADNLMVPIVAHAAYDVVALVLLRRRVLLRPERTASEAQG